MVNFAVMVMLIAQEPLESEQGRPCCLGFFDCFL